MHSHPAISIHAVAIASSPSQGDASRSLILNSSEVAAEAPQRCLTSISCASSAVMSELAPSPYIILGLPKNSEKISCDAQVLSSSLAQLSGAGKSLVGMDLSGASAQLRRMDGECRCPLEMLRCVNEADRCLTDSVSRLR